MNPHDEKFHKNLYLGVLSVILNCSQLHLNQVRANELVVKSAVRRKYKQLFHTPNSWFDNRLIRSPLIKMQLGTVGNSWELKWELQMFLWKSFLQKCKSLSQSECSASVFGISFLWAFSSCEWAFKNINLLCKSLQNLQSPEIIQKR